MADRTIEIIVDIADKTGGKLRGIQSDLLAMDKVAQRLSNRFKSLAATKYQATLQLIDRVTEPGNRINNLLKRIAGKTYRVLLHLNDSALGKIRQVETLLMRIAGKAWTIGLNVRDSATKKLNGLMSGAMMGAGMFMPVAGMAGVGFGAANAIRAYAGFEQQMSKVQAIRQLSKDSQDMKDLYKLAKDLGASTAWTRQQVGEAMYYQALAGWSTQNILKATPHMLNLASAGGMDLGSASDLVTDAMTAFGLQATNTYTNARGKSYDMAEYFVDMLAKLQASSNTDLYQAREAIKYGAPTIGTMFANVEGQEGVQLRTEAARQMMIMTGLMANAGIKGSMAGTGINTLFNRLAGENRNTHFAERLLGLEHAENGNMLMPLDFIKGFQRKIKEGMSVDDFMQVAEELAGEKIHADTRRKLDSTIESALKNGGKLGSADVMKMGSMLAGLENMPKILAMVFQDIDALEAKMTDVEGTAGGMANTMLDNLAGSFTILGSAWDAFQQSFLEGQAGDGLRNFVDALTQVISRATKLFEDGIQFADIGKIIGDVIGRLKNKFLELDGIGSVLAGGALMAGLLKVGSVAQRTIGYFKALKGLQVGQMLGTTTTAGGLSAAQKVGTMNVSAGVVNVNGKVGGTGGGFGGGGSGSGRSRQRQRMPDFWASPEKARAQAIMANYQSAKDFIRGEKASLAAERKFFNAERVANMRGAFGSGAAFAGIFSLLDIMNVKAANAERLAAATDENRAQVIRENRQAEWEASVGGLGAVVGAGLGAALGSMAGPMGTMIGGIVGGMIGEKLGISLGDKGAEDEQPPQPKNAFAENAPPSVETPGSWGAFQRMQDEGSYSHLKGIREAQIRRQQQDAQEREQIRREQEVDKKYAGRDAWFKQNHLEQFNPFNQQDGGAFDYYREQAEHMKEFFGGHDFSSFGTRAEAGTPTEAQLATEGQVALPPIAPPETSALDEWITGLEAQLTEGLTSIAEGAGEIFSGLSETISAGLDAASSAASSALESIQSAFTTAKESVQTAWGELPGFFDGVFSGLGGAASAAGSAIMSGLTSVIGAVIGAWESAASTISGIISSISSMASSIHLPSFGGGVGKAEGGFVSSETHFFAGEHGPEAIIPLAPSKRSRALELFERTAAILNGGTMNFGGDELGDEDAEILGGTYSGGTSGGQSSGVQINLGGIQATFNVTGGNAQETMQTIQENLFELADKVAARLAVTIDDIHHNQTLAG